MTAATDEQPAVAAAAPTADQPVTSSQADAVTPEPKTNGVNGAMKDGEAPAKPEAAEAPTKPEDCGCGANEKDLDVSNAIPSAEALKKCEDLTVLDAEGKEHTFKSIVEGDGSVDKHMVIFIRHFFCGLCQEYTRTLSLDIPPATLPPRTAISIIGCGQPDLIAAYTAETHSAYTLYTDPKCRLYAALDMQRTLSMGSRAPQYVRNGMLAGALRSVVQGLTWKGGRGALKGGPASQNGGEFWFVKGASGGMAGWQVEFCHRMRNTRDHSEMVELRKVMGVAAAPGDDGAAQAATAATVDDGANGAVKQSTEKDEAPMVTKLNGNGEVERPERPGQSKRRSSSLLRGFSWRKNSQTAANGEAKGKEKSGYTKLDDGGAESGNAGAIEVH